MRVTRERRERVVRSRRIVHEASARGHDEAELSGFVWEAFADPWVVGYRGCPKYMSSQIAWSLCCSISSTPW
jgi:hypothetical protein